MVPITLRTTVVRSSAALFAFALVFVLADIRRGGDSPASWPGTTTVLAQGDPNVIVNPAMYADL